MNEILILYYSRQGSTAALARQICRGDFSLSRGAISGAEHQFPPETESLVDVVHVLSRLIFHD